MLKNIKIFCKFFRPIRKISTTSSQRLNFVDGVPNVKDWNVPLSKYAGQTTVTMITGHKCGDQGFKYINSIFETIQAPIILERLDNSDSRALMNENLLSIIRNGIAILIDETHITKNKQKSLLMNQQLDLFAYVINFRTLPYLTPKFHPVDILVIAQNNKGDFSKLEYEPIKGLVETIKICFENEARKYIELAYKYAIDHGRKKIVFVHKRDQLPLCDGPPMRIAKEMHETKYPQIEIEFILINYLIETILTNPMSLDVICMDEKYGTFISSLLSTICGGVGLFSAVEMGHRYAMFKPLQTKLSVTGMDDLCPHGVISTVIDLLTHLGYTKCAGMIYDKLLKLLAEEAIKTSELGSLCPREDVLPKLLKELEHTTCDS